MTWLKENISFILVGSIVLFAVVYGFFAYQNLSLDKKKAIAEYCTSIRTTLPENNNNSIVGRLTSPSETSSRNFSNLDEKCLEYFSK